MPTPKKKQFIFNYTGNKFNESKNLKTDFTKYTKIVECFGGSFGFSRYLYINDKVNPDATFDIYDIDEDMIEFFNYIKSLNLEEYTKFINDYNDFCELIINSECNLNNKKKNMVSRLQMLDYIEKECKETPKFIKYLLLHNATTCHFTTIAIKDSIDEKYFEMFKKCSFYPKRYETIEFDKYDKQNTLFYLDPPYLLECNSFYKKLDKVEVDTYYETMLMLFKTYNTYLTTSHNWLVNYVFGKWKIDTYDKLYQINKTRRVHVSYYNILKTPRKIKKTDTIDKSPELECAKTLCDLSGCKDTTKADIKCDIKCEVIPNKNDEVIKKVKIPRKKKVVKKK